MTEQPARIHRSLAVLVAQVMAQLATEARAHFCGRDGCDHASCCALHNEPALPVGPCDCGLAA